MSVSFRIREATLDDNDALIELIRRCPVRGPLHVALDRSPDYFAFLRMQGPRSQVFVAETLNGGIVGSMVLVESGGEAWEGSRVLRLADLRTDPSFRHTRVAAALMEKYRSRLIQEGFAYGLVETLQNKAPPRKTQRLLGEQVEVWPEGRFELYQLPPLRPFSKPAGMRVRTAEIADIPALSDLLLSHYADTMGRPSFDEEWLLASLQQHNSFGLEHMWLAEDDRGKILACAGVWDQRQLRQTLTVRLGRFMRVFLRFLALIGFLWKVPPLPAPGRLLRFAHLRWPACARGQEKALGVLIRHLLTVMREGGEYQFLAVGLPEGDRLKASLKGILRFKTRIFLYSHRVKARQEPAGLSKLGAPLRPFVDASLI